MGFGPPTLERKEKEVQGLRGTVFKLERLLMQEIVEDSDVVRSPFSMVLYLKVGIGYRYARRVYPLAPLLSTSLISRWCFWTRRA